jgi:hypothetical protein
MSHRHRAGTRGHEIRQPALDLAQRRQRHHPLHFGAVPRSGRWRWKRRLCRVRCCCLALSHSGLYGGSRITRGTTTCSELLLLSSSVRLATAGSRCGLGRLAPGADAGSVAAGGRLDLWLARAAGTLRATYGPPRCYLAGCPSVPIVPNVLILLPLPISKRIRTRCCFSSFSTVPCASGAKAARVAPSLVTMSGGLLDPDDAASLGDCAGDCAIADGAMSHVASTIVKMSIMCPPKRRAEMRRIGRQSNCRPNCRRPRWAKPR